MFAQAEHKKTAQDLGVFGTQKFTRCPFCTKAQGPSSRDVADPKWGEKVPLNATISILIFLQQSMQNESSFATLLLQLLHRNWSPSSTVAYPSIILKWGLFPKMAQKDFLCFGLSSIHLAALFQNKKNYCTKTQQNNRGILCHLASFRRHKTGEYLAKLGSGLRAKVPRPLRTHAENLETNGDIGACA